jgi:hypothetical protein
MWNNAYSQHECMNTQLRTQAKLQELHSLLKVQPSSSACNDNSVSISSASDIIHKNRANTGNESDPKGDDVGRDVGGIGGNDSKESGGLGSGNSNKIKSTTKMNSSSSKMKPSGHGFSCGSDENGGDCWKQNDYSSQDSKACALESGNGSGPRQDKMLEELRQLLADMSQVSIVTRWVDLHV